VRESEKEVNEMTKVGQKYKCNICGNEVVVTNSGQGAGLLRSADGINWRRICM